MSKYFSVFKISFQQEFVYRLNFIMWRVRNVMQIFLIFFLWDAVFQDPGRQVFGYDRAKILTYVFLLVLIKSFVMSARSMDVAGEVSRGDLTNYLLKPVNYFKYWFTRDVSSKALNILFSIGEAFVLYLILRPPFFLQTNLVQIILFLAALLLAIILYYLLLMLFSMTPFWYPEHAWGMVFLLLVFSEFMGGAMFPLDIFPASVQNIFYLLPFPYLLFMPIQIYLGKVAAGAALKAVLVSVAWVTILTFVLKAVWSFGLKAYRAEGR